MKTKLLLPSFTAVVAAAALLGCNKETSSTETAAPPAAPASAPGTEAVVPAATAAVKEAATAVQAKADSLIAQAKSYIADKKYTDALNTLNKVSGMVLTAEQQQTVADLKAQVQKLLASGTSAVEATKSLLGK